MAEEARLESVYTPKGYPEFESRSLRNKEDTSPLFLCTQMSPLVRHRPQHLLNLGSTVVSEVAD